MSVAGLVRVRRGAVAGCWCVEVNVGGVWLVKDWWDEEHHKPALGKVTPREMAIAWAHELRDIIRTKRSKMGEGD